MTFDADALYRLLPSFHRARDAEHGGPLKALLAVIAEQVGAVEESLNQLSDDQFIETCAEWVVPYIGDLLAARGLHPVSAAAQSRRTEVANTVALRRRKGTAAVVEQLARDVTGWPAHAVEFFRRVVTTPNVNHRRPPAPATLALRPAAALRRLGGAFDGAARLPDVRRPAAGGRVNLPNVGVFLWRLESTPLTFCPAAKVDDRRWKVHPLGYDVPLFARPEPGAAVTDLATPANLPVPVTREMLRDGTPDLYGAGRSLLVRIDGSPVAAADIVACNLADAAGGAWAHRSPTKVAVDPELGRLALPLDRPAPQRVEVSWHYGAAARAGGGEYDRLATLARAPVVVRCPADFPTIQAALNGLAARLAAAPPAPGAALDGVVEVGDEAASGVFREALTVPAVAGARVELRAANRVRPFVISPAGIDIRGGDAGSEVTLSGLTVVGTVRATATLARLTIRHATLIPDPTLVAGPALVAAATVGGVVIENSVVGAIRADVGVETVLTNSVLDAGAPDRVAYSAADGAGPAGELQVTNGTLMGRVHTRHLKAATNSLFLADPGTGWAAPVLSDRVQDGCVRFCYLPPGARVPRRYRCPPERAADDPLVRPRFVSTRYGRPGYFQLLMGCAPAIRQGADDESEMGAFHDLFQPQRETNLRLRLAEYLRFGLDAGVYFES